MRGTDREQRLLASYSFTPPPPRSEMQAPGSAISLHEKACFLKFITHSMRATVSPTAHRSRLPYDDHLALALCLKPFTSQALRPLLLGQMNPHYNTGYKVFGDTCSPHRLAVAHCSPRYHHTKLTSGTRPNSLFYDLIHNSPRNLNL